MTRFVLTSPNVSGTLPTTRNPTAVLHGIQFCFNKLENCLDGSEIKSRTTSKVTKIIMVTIMIMIMITIVKMMTLKTIAVTTA